MFALVNFAFAGGHYNKKKYLFTTDIENLEKGDLVIVEGPNKGERVIAMFFGYVKEDISSEIKRKSILRKAYTKNVKSLIKVRRKYFTGLPIEDSLFTDLRKAFNEYVDATDNELKALVINRLIAAPRTLCSMKNMQVFHYEDMVIIVENSSISTVKRKGSFEIKRPGKLEAYM